MSMIPILLADDHCIVREGVKLILESTNEFQVVGEVSHGDELIDAVLKKKPHLIVSDLMMPGTSILENCKQMKEKIPELKVVVLTAFANNQDIQKAMLSGIDGYVLKDSMPQQIINTMRLVSAGYLCFQPNHETCKNKANHEIHLTERELQIFRLVKENLNNQEIAQRLFISEATVKTHVSSILRKTGQPNRAQAVLYAIKVGLL
ncbi:response regulator [Heliobacillus mobilis]|uniref:Stage 0 sporulation protein A homolog n=1 Tax=Heliobacterium mobile TaxID=28064 RepID=A0A6I3SP27_HELMO|nr:response regulator transcription factor [Heliobacterium mobile]MTV49997.1 response regulator [Heliobacterium mobile]